ncbi:MAG: zf-HC2 domain-containing protein [Proteobacteria bacterium]|nr:zf-HC2 domain-containing protein [Pseudomonadota bacterium]
MKCRDVEKRLKAFLDSELKAEDEIRIRQHIYLCPTCTREMEQFSKTWDLVAELPVVETETAPLFIKILRKIEAREMRGPFRRFLEGLIVVPTPALAGLALIMGLFLGGEAGFLLYSTAFAPHMEIAASRRGAYYEELFADISPQSLEEGYFRLSTEIERSRKP